MYRRGVFPLLLLLSTLYPVKPDCTSAEEGQETSLTCTVNTTALFCHYSIKLEWRVNKPAPVIVCTSNECGGGYSSFFGISATINNSGSTLTIPNVSRTDPLNMETRWACWPCGSASKEVTTCDKLEVYAKPENPSCTVRENTAVPGDIESVTVSCSTTKVYPEAKCSLEWRTNGGTFVTINKTPTYNHTELTGTPTYYRSECSVDVPVAELGEGTHSFRAFIYPTVTDGINLVAATTASTTVTLTLPEASYTCSTEMIQGYFNGKSARCTCSLTSDGYPKGQAQWYRGSQTVPGVSGGVLDITFDSNNPEQIYTCKGMSAIGKGSGSTLTTKFAFFEQDTVVFSSPNNNSMFDLCDGSNQITAVCAVLKDNVYPAPTFSFSQTYLPFDNSQERQDGSYYQRQVDLRPDVGGIHRVTCTVTNTIIISETQSKEISLTLRKPPPLPPKIFIKGKTYQGVNALNRITLAAGYTGDMTCRVEGGYPKAHTTQLTCGSLTASGRENVATLTYQDGQLNKDMDGTECKCTSQHVTGCYDNKETSLTLDVTYAPVISFTHDSASSEFNEGDTPTFTCTARGNPPPNLTVTRKRTNQQLASVQGNLKTAELTHTVEPLNCLDTDVYVCAGQNNQGVNTKEISVGVKCPQQAAFKISQPRIVEVALKETAELGLEIYGYPSPHLLTLIRTRDNTNLTGSARHLIEYSPGQAPFGIVNVTIFFVEEEDFINYTLTVDNGEGDPLVYPFYLAEVKATEKVKQEEQGGSEDDTVAIAISVTVAVVAVVVIAVILVILVLRYRAASRKSPLFQPALENRYVDIFSQPADGYEVPVTHSEGEGMRPEGRNQVQSHAYDEIDTQPVNGTEMPDGLVQEEAPGHRQLRVNQYEEINPRQVNQYEVPRGLLQEEDMKLKGQRQLRVNQYEEINPGQVNQYDVPRGLPQEEDMKLKDETVQQPYANVMSPDQETKGTNHNHSNLGFDISEEKCVYVNTAGHDNDREK
ncbi:cell adhesion molecule [Plakobranchus ocellatus]|uniref:Cell adhesion molecule n=1 Tax=Plakobranchus ocellatus TaxID=259542 RepID=A0AAV3YP80_9GAST|nr:cell adhesion molecule [Plakobranchus ocellatus]